MNTAGCYKKKTTYLSSRKPIGFISFSIAKGVTLFISVGEDFFDDQPNNLISESATYNKCRLNAKLLNAAEFWVSDLWCIFRLWLITVCSQINNLSAICLLVKPSASQGRISFSTLAQLPPTCCPLLFLQLDNYSNK